MDLKEHRSLDHDGTYIATYGTDKERGIEEKQLLAITDVEDGSYTCLQRIAGTHQESILLEALGNTEAGEALEDPERIEDGPHSEEELYIFEEGLGKESTDEKEHTDELVDQYGVDEAMELLDSGQETTVTSIELPDSGKARKKLKHLY